MGGGEEFRPKKVKLDFEEEPPKISEGKISEAYRVSLADPAHA